MTTQPPKYALTVALHPDGWRLHLLHDGNAQSARLPVTAVEQIARLMTEAVPGSGGGDGEVTPFQLARTATASLKQQVEAELKAAEDTAKTVPSLRKALSEIESI